jgi:sortase A
MKNKRLFLLIILIVILIISFNYISNHITRINIEETNKLIKIEKQKIENDNNNIAKKSSNAVATIYIKNLINDIPIFRGVTDDILYRGIGMETYSVEFGNNGQTILSGHRESVFNPLKHIKINDIIVIKLHKKTFNYKVIKLMIINEKRADLFLKSNLNYNELILNTCYPIDGKGFNPTKRFIVVAQIIN